MMFQSLGFDELTYVLRTDGIIAFMLLGLPSLLLILLLLIAWDLWRQDKR